MATSRLSEVVQHLRRAVLLKDGAGLTDGQLLERFVALREDAALAALVRRHAPMVWGVCRRILQDHHHAEDAFQATFLVLVRKAASVVPREMVANWLYGVACQTALKARATAARRQTRERQVPQMPEPATAEHDLWNDLQFLLDQELSRLPEKYRIPVILCDLEGKTRKEAARQMRMPEGTVASRLARARTMLAKRLARRGLAVRVGSLAAVLSQNVASASAPTAIVSSTIKAVGLLAAGQAAAKGAISVKVAALTEGVVKAMLLSKLKVVTAVLLGVGIVVLSTGASGVFASRQIASGMAGTAAPSPQPPQDKKGTVEPDKKDVDWKEVEDGVRGLAQEHLQPLMKGAHGDMPGIHGWNGNFMDCRKCHSIIAPEKGNDAAKGQPSDESVQERVRRLEAELAKMRNEKELLQLEVWVLLKEIQRQNLQKKGGR